DAKGGRDGVAAPFHGKLDDVLGVEIFGIGGKACAGRVLDALVDGEDRDVAGSAEPAVVEQGLEIAKDHGGAIGGDQHAVDEIRAGQVQRFLGESSGLVGQQA